MTWGTTGNITTANVDSDADDPSLARADIKAAFDELTAVINGRGAANGVASLNASSQIPSTQLPDTLTSTSGLDLNLAPDTEKVTITYILNLGARTTAQLEQLDTDGDSDTGDVAYCSDGDTGSPCLAVYNGTDWLRISLGSAIASS